MKTRQLYSILVDEKIFPKGVIIAYADGIDFKNGNVILYNNPEYKNMKGVHLNISIAKDIWYSITPTEKDCILTEDIINPEHERI